MKNKKATFKNISLFLPLLSSLNLMSMNQEKHITTNVELQDVRRPIRPFLEKSEEGSKEAKENVSYDDSKEAKEDTAPRTNTPRASTAIPCAYIMPSLSSSSTSSLSSSSSSFAPQTSYLKSQAVLEPDEKQYPLHYAAAIGDTQSVMYLVLSRTVNPNIADRYGRTPLHYAAYFGQTQIVHYLLNNLSKSRRGEFALTNINGKDANGYSAREYARVNGHSCTDEVFEHYYRPSAMIVPIAPSPSPEAEEEHAEASSPASPSRHSPAIFNTHNEEEGTETTRTTSESSHYPIVSNSNINDEASATEQSRHVVRSVLRELQQPQRTNNNNNNNNRNCCARCLASRYSLAIVYCIGLGVTLTIWLTLLNPETKL